MREMRPPTFFVLLALADGVKHGYAILADVERLSSGRVGLQVGTLYAVIERLTNQGWVRVTEEVVVRGRARRYLELTEAGRAALEAETGRLEQDARTARVRLRPVAE
jgi:DNA-binding PadR family transcriptional regulator